MSGCGAWPEAKSKALLSSPHLSEDSLPVVWVPCCGGSVVSSTEPLARDRHQIFVE